MTIRRFLPALTAVLLLAAPVHAVNPDEMLADPTLEARAREVSKGLRCVVCQNQSIDDSDADLARDMRLLVRERLRKGDSDEAVRQFMVDRYGNFVLLKPPLETTTYVLWFGPALFALIALVGGGALYRARARAKAVAESAPGPAAAPLSSAEKARLDALLKDSGDDA